MTADKIKNVSGSDIVIGSTTLVKNALTALSGLPLDSDSELRGKLFHHLESNDIEVYDSSDTIIDSTSDASWDREENGEVVETVNVTVRSDIESLNAYINSIG